MSGTGSRSLRLLFLLTFVPRVDARHGGRATAQLIARLAERHEVAILCLRANDEEPVDDVLRGLCALVEEVGACSPADFGWRVARRIRLVRSLAKGVPIAVADTESPELRQRLRELVRHWRPDVVHAELERTAQYLDALEGAAAARVLGAAEAAGETARELAGAAKRLDRVERYLDLRAWRRFEAVNLRRFDAIVVYNERDRRALAPLAHGMDIETIPLLLDLPERPSDPSGREPGSILFVGGFGHPPNVEAASRLATRILPRILLRRPDTLLYLVGEKPPPQLTRLAGERIVVTGPVPDVQPYLERAAVVVIPLSLGGGVRLKLLEALAAGKAIVASPRAAEGLNVADGAELFIARGDEEFADAVVRLLDHPDARAQLARRAREWAEASCDWRPILAAYETVYTNAIAHRRAQIGQTLPEAIA